MVTTVRKTKLWMLYALAAGLALVLYAGAAVAQDGGNGSGTRDRLNDRDQDQIRDQDQLQDCLETILLAADQDRDRLRTRDQLRDCDLQMTLTSRPASGYERERHRQEVRNEFWNGGIVSPASLLLVGWQPLGLF
jgi:hypothetical protein